MAESPERAAEWDNAAVGDEVDLLGPDGEPPCGAAVPTGEGELYCTRDRGHTGDHVATGLGVVLFRSPA